MSRSKGSGWGNGSSMLWQKCPDCGKKKALFEHVVNKFKCSACKCWFFDETGLLFRSRYITNDIKKTLMSNIQKEMEAKNGKV